MKKSRWLRQLAWLMIFWLNIISVQAALNKFSIIPTLRPQTPIAANGVALAQYLIINNTFEPRFLTIAPQDGVIQLTPTGGCSSPFLLFHDQSCLLTLQILGALTKGGVHSGPTICKTLSVNDNRPDYFLCTAADLRNSIDVSTTGVILPATITGLSSGAAITISNTSFDASADHLKAILPPNSTISEISGCPKVLPPQSSCTFYFSSTTAGTFNVVVKGSNTNSVILPVTFSLQALNLKPTNSASTIMKELNLSSGKISETYTLALIAPEPSAAPIAKLKIKIPSGLPVSIANNSCKTGLDHLNNSCKLNIVAGDGTGSGRLSIQGLDHNLEPVTNTIFLPIKVLSSSLASISISPTSGVINVDDPSQSTIFTLTNNLASPVSLSGIHSSLPADWMNVSENISANCDNLAPGASCKLSFAATSSYPARGGIQIKGENSAEPVNIALGFVQDKQ